MIIVYLIVSSRNVRTKHTKKIDNKSTYLTNRDSIWQVDLSWVTETHFNRFLKCDFKSNSSLSTPLN